MGFTVTNQLTIIDACETDPPGWTIYGGVGTLARRDTSDEMGPPFYGTYMYGFDADIEDGGHYATFATQDYSSSICYCALSVFDAANLEVIAPGSGNAGVYIIGVDSSANIGLWYVGGSDTYRGGWTVFVADLSRTPDANNGTNPDMSDCTGLGIGVNHLGKSKATNNCFIDLLRVSDVGDGVKLVTTASSVATLQDIVDNEGTGLVTELGGLYYSKVPLICGDTAAGDIEFLDTSEWLVFEDLDVPAGHYGITVQGNASGTIKFQLGTKSGTRGISGLQIRGGKPFHLTAMDTDIDELKLHGTTFTNAADMSFPVTASGREVVDCTFVESGEVDVNTCPFTYCSWIDADDGGGSVGAVLISSTSHNLTNCSLIDCPDGIRFNTPGSYNLTNVLFSGCTYDIGNDSGGEVVVNALGTSDPSSSENTRYQGTARQKAKVFDYDAGTPVYTDETTDYNDADADDVALLADGDENGTGEANCDGIYIGNADAKFKKADINVSTIGTGTYTIAARYWNGSAWATLAITDGTNGFTNSGWNSITITTIPSDWATTSVDGVTAYWIFVYLATGTCTVDPLAQEGALVGDTDINNTVSVSVTAQESDGTKIETARVLLESDGAPLPSDALVTITRVTTTATVSHTGHGQSNGDKVAIRNAEQPEYNGIKTISNVQTNSYDYTVSGTPATPATGTITSTAVILDGTTNASGVVSRADFNYASNQPVRGLVRKGTASPYYVTTPLTGSISSAGYDTTAIMSSDE